MSRSAPGVSATRPRVAVVVVDWNAADLTARCLSALADQTVPSSQLLVIDNASPAPTWQQIVPGHPRLDLLRLPRNRGFAAAQNLGVALAADCDWIAVLNPDAYPEPEWLEKLLEAATENPDVSFFASRQVMADRPGHIDGTGDTYAVSGLAWRRDHGLPAEGRRVKADEVFGPCAAAALYKREALAEVGGFDDSFFCYFEDVDLAFRLRLAGHRCLYVPDAVVHHVGSASSGRHSDFSVYHGHRNLVWTFWKNMPAGLLAAYLPHHLLLNAVSLAHFTARGQGPAILRAKRDAIRGLPRVIRTRRILQAGRRVSAGALRDRMVGGIRSLGVGRFSAGA